jgi:pimeloyl-ACP methyl ester carboxylesterase
MRRPDEIVSERMRVPGRQSDVAVDRVEAANPRGSVLLVHGYTGSKEDFAPILPLLARAGFSAYAYDQRGQYESKAEGPFSLDGWADDAEAIGAHLPGHFRGSPVHLVGHSFGGLVATRAAIRHPRAWSSVTLLCSGPGGHGEHPELRLMLATLQQFDLAEVHRRKRQVELAAGDSLRSEAVEAFLEHRFVSANPAAVIEMTQILIDSPDETAELAATALPVHVVYGERDDAWPQHVQDRMAAGLGTFSVVIPDADHSPAIEQPQTTVDVMLALFAGGSQPPPYVG